MLIELSASTRVGKLSAFFFQNASIFDMRSAVPSSSSMVLMPNTLMGLPLAAAHLANSSTFGRPFMQGPHQVAQKSMTTTLPFRLARLTSVPSLVFSLKSGASPPVSSDICSLSGESTALRPLASNAMGVGRLVS